MNVGSIFAGIGALILTCVVAYIFYRFYHKFIQFLDLIINRVSKECILEEVFLDRIAQKKGIDLDKELIKRDMLKDTKRKSLGRRIQDQIYEDMFSDKTKDTSESETQ